MAAPVLIGTASWADKALTESGKFYPPDADSAEARLRFYASRFPLVEVDTTYYGLPQQSMAEQWAERTPDDFVFDVKAFALFTEHPAAVARLPKELRAELPAALAGKRNLYRKDAPPDVVDYCWRAFIDGLSPLAAAGKLGVVVFQFPKWVFPNRRTWSYFDEIKDRLGTYRAAVEFRNDIWLRADNREETLNRLGDLDFSYICVDEPQGFRSSVPPVVAASNDLGFVRFHGRNRDTWEKRTARASDRFDYRYEEAEFKEWVPGFHELVGETRAVHAIMNTNNDDQGPANAELLAGILRAAGLNVRPGG